MAVLTWDGSGEKIYETGTDHGVLYRKDEAGEYPLGVAWNGLTAVTESPTGADFTSLWADNIEYAKLQSAESYGATVECYTYPDEFKECNGEAELLDGAVTVGQQTRQPFGMSYRSLIGNDIYQTDYGYKIHLIYNCVITPSDKGYVTVNDTPDAVTFSYEMTSTPENVTGYKPSSTMVIDSTKATDAQIKAIEDVIYGSDTEEARLPLPDEVMSIMESAAGGGGAQG